MTTPKPPAVLLALATTGLFLVTACELPMSGSSNGDWRARMARTMPLLGKRNRIVIANASFPMLAKSGVQTVYVGGDQLTAVATVLSMVDQTNHLRPLVTVDSELDQVSEKDAGGITDYRQKLAALLADREPTHRTQQALIADLIDLSQSYRVVLLKTATALPYTTVSIELDCGFWTPEAERRLRAGLQGSDPAGSDDG